MKTRIVRTVAKVAVLVLGVVSQENVKAESYTAINKFRVGASAFSFYSPRFDCNSVLRRKTSSVAISTLYASFGNSDRCIKRLPLKRRRYAIQVHLFNGAGRRNGRLSPLEFRRRDSIQKWCSRWRGYRGSFKNRALRYTAAALRRRQVYNRITWIVSPELESNCHGRAANNLVTFAKEEFAPDYVAWNPLSSKKQIEGTLHELHGLRIPPRPCVYNFDGLDIKVKGLGTPLEPWVSTELARQIMKDNRGCQFRFWWTKESNCLVAGEKFRFPHLRGGYCGAVWVR